LSHFVILSLHKQNFFISLYLNKERASLTTNLFEKQNMLNFIFEPRALGLMYNYIEDDNKDIYRPELNSKISETIEFDRRCINLVQAQKIRLIIKKLDLYKWNLYNKTRTLFLSKSKQGFVDIYKILNFETFHMSFKPWMETYFFYKSFISFGIYLTSFNYSISNFYFLSFLILLIQLILRPL
jgi:hypothetical protein